MWLLLAFLSATLLGFYDVFKKKSLKDNAVLPVLFLNTFFSSLIFLPFILFSIYEPNLLEGSIFNVPVAGWEQHKYIIIKSFIVLSSWIFGYFGMKHLPIMDRCAAGCCLFFHAEPFGKERRNRLQA